MSQQKIVNPSAERNKAPILEILLKYLSTDVSGQVLEISSGTGQHTAFFAPKFPNLTFQPSEHDKTMLPHIKQYINSCPSKNIKDPLNINICTPINTWGLDTNEFDYIININMIHITPFICTQNLFKNSGLLLKSEGLLITYGPYGDNGVIEPESNIKFDQMLRRQNPEWGVRDIVKLKELAQQNNISLIKIHDMPANNKTLIWKKM